jgi:geranylgeranyl reductase
LIMSGHSVLLAGEGICCAMIGGRLAAEAVDEFLETGRAKALHTARKRFMGIHGIVFWILGGMRCYCYSNDRRRELFVSLCRDRDIQKLTWDAYMNKELVRAKPVAHIGIFFNNLAHMAGLASA